MPKYKALKVITNYLASFRALEVNIDSITPKNKLVVYIESIKEFN